VGADRNPWLKYRLIARMTMLVVAVYKSGKNMGGGKINDY